MCSAPVSREKGKRGKTGEHHTIQEHRKPLTTYPEESETDALTIPAENALDF